MKEKKKEESESKKVASVPVKGVEMIVRGLVFIYEKNGYANLRCPFETKDSDNPIAANHKLRLKITSGLQGSDELAVSEIAIPNGSLVEIINTNNIPPAVSTFNGVLNIATEHHPRPVKFVADIDDLSTHIKINGIQLSESDDAKHKHNFKTWEIINHGSGNEIRNRRTDKTNVISAVNGVISFADLAIAQTIIKIKSPKNNPKSQMEIRLTYRDETSAAIHHNIELTNLCNRDVDNRDTYIECDTKSDFLAYYPLITQNGFGKKFDFIAKTNQNERAPCNVIYCSTDPE